MWWRTVITTPITRLIHRNNNLPTVAPPPARSILPEITPNETNSSNKMLVEALVELLHARMASFQCRHRLPGTMTFLRPTNWVLCRFTNKQKPTAEMLLTRQRCCTFEGFLITTTWVCRKCGRWEDFLRSLWCGFHVTCRGRVLLDYSRVTLRIWGEIWKLIIWSFHGDDIKSNAIDVTLAADVFCNQNEIPNLVNAPKHLLCQNEKSIAILASILRNEKTFLLFCR